MIAKRPLLDHSNYPSHTCPNFANQTPFNDLSTTILNNLVDGILILTEAGELLQSNQVGRRMCDRIAQHYPCIGQVPQEIWQACQVLIKSRRDFPKHLTTAESELLIKQTYDQFRIRARWLNIGQHSTPKILVILENHKHSQQNLARTEVIRYGLSPREADVWVLHRIGYTYQEIAAELYIALNTVKKHIKNIYAKQHLVAIMEESCPEELAS
ncbi:MAG: LuxR C-terminal-related transcriptional regulator [Cyanobacteria bacterium P01_F01_bin.13]